MIAELTHQMEKENFLLSQLDIPVVLASHFQNIFPGSLQVVQTLQYDRQQYNINKIGPPIEKIWM